MLDEDSGQLLQLVKLVEETVAQDQKFRETYQVNNKFLFISRKLQNLLTELHDKVKVIDSASSKHSFLLGQDEVLVYVYLYNAQDVSIQGWQALLTPQAFVDYSINRPIYRERSEIEYLIKSKANVLQHAYLVVAIKQTDIVESLADGSTPMKDLIGQSLLKIRDGSLQLNRVHSFVHNQIEYFLNKDLLLIRGD